MLLKLYMKHRRLKILPLRWSEFKVCIRMLMLNKGNVLTGWYVDLLFVWRVNGHVNGQTEHSDTGAFTDSTSTEAFISSALCCQMRCVLSPLNSTEPPLPHMEFVLTFDKQTLSRWRLVSGCCCGEKRKVKLDCSSSNWKSGECLFGGLSVFRLLCLIKDKTPKLSK